MIVNRKMKLFMSIVSVSLLFALDEYDCCSGSEKKTSGAPKATEAPENPEGIC